jgi:BirA family biotin operon repressor/biotin-[acetyl-CoA-carboxylase] ligase
MTAPGPADASPAERWPDALEAALARTRGTLSRCVMLRETASTQDHARAAGIEPGTVVVAWRQTAGRGRLGRAWADTGTDGVAATFALPAAPPESLAMRSAVAAASAARRFVAGDACGVKWPNDVVVDGRKLAGVLVERIDGTALVGIGINVRQTSFPPPLDGHATSLAMHGPAPDRLDVLVALLEEIGIAFTADEADIYRTYRALDRMSGRRCAFLTAEGQVEGLVEEVDPLRGLRVRDGTEVRFLPAATTSVVPPASGSRYGGTHGPS